jgi:hypothetical protein
MKRSREPSCDVKARKSSRKDLDPLNTVDSDKEDFGALEQLFNDIKNERGKATILHPTLCKADFALAIVLKIRVLESIKKEKGNTVKVGGMTYFLETKGWETFRSLKDWMLSTGYAQYTHLYSGVKCSISY